MMRIAVCLKWIADLDSVDVDPIRGTVDASRLLFVLDPGAESALAVALKHGAEVVALTVGTVAAEGALRIALAAGAAKVIRLDAEPRPALTAALLARAIEAEGPFDLVLMGTRSFDHGSGEVPALVAETLGLPIVTDVTALALGPLVEAERELDGGTKEIVRLGGAAVVALGPDVARLPTASLPGVMKAQRATIEVRREPIAALATDPVVVQRTELPPRPRVRPVAPPTGTPDERLAAIAQGAAGTRARGRILEGTPAEMADAIVLFLRERGIVHAQK